jgi:type IV pilus biogenesis protein CpaD/CtpE
MPARAHPTTSLILAAVLAMLAACGPADKEDMLKKAANVRTRAELEQALGKPSDIAKLGPLEKWTYKAANGEVVFILTGDTVAMQATGAAPAAKP